jgi:SAM-dependent methyltransferase
MSEMDLKKMYQKRFEGQLAFRRSMWSVLCKQYLQLYFPPESTIAEIGAGYCEFINSIQAAKKIAVDINPDTIKYADSNVLVVQTNSVDLSKIGSSTVDRVFASNYFEHLSHSDITATLSEILRILVPGGRIVILQPNFRYCYKNYFMFFDHITALDHHSMEEVLGMIGFKIEKIVPRFLPFTTQSDLPKSLFLLKLYLQLPFLWKLFGGQMFVVASK